MLTVSGADVYVINAGGNTTPSMTVGTNRIALVLHHYTAPPTRATITLRACCSSRGHGCGGSQRPSGTGCDP